MADEISRAGPPHPVVWRRDARQHARQDARQDSRRGGREPDERPFRDPIGHPPDALPGEHDAGRPPAETLVATDWSDALDGDGGAFSSHGRADHARAAGAYERLAVDGAAQPVGLSAHGIPASEMTPAVRRALSRLSGEIDRLRHEMEARGLDADILADMRERADHLPLLGARALERTLRLRLAARDDGAATPAVLFFYMANFEEVRERHGLAAAEAAYHHMASALSAARHDDEDIGAPGGAGVVVLAPFAGQVDALWARVRALGREAMDPIPWGREALRITLLAGVHLPRRGEQAADALWQAERAARRMV